MQAEVKDGLKVSIASLDYNLMLGILITCGEYRVAEHIIYAVGQLSEKQLYNELYAYLDFNKLIKKDVKDASAEKCKA